MAFSASAESIVFRASVGRDDFLHGDTHFGGYAIDHPKGITDPSPPCTRREGIPYDSALIDMSLDDLLRADVAELQGMNVVGVMVEISSL